MMGKDRRKIVTADRVCPALKQRFDCSFVFGLFGHGCAFYNAAAGISQRQLA
jgi:hypothetical protein